MGNGIEMMSIAEEASVELLIEKGEPPVQRKSESAEETLNLSQVATSGAENEEE